MAKIRIAERKRNHVTLNEVKLAVLASNEGKERKGHNRILAYSTIVRGRRKKINEFLRRYIIFRSVILKKEKSVASSSCSY